MGPGCRPESPLQGQGCVRRTARRSACPRQSLGKPLPPPFLKSSALNYNGAVALLTFVFTTEAKLVVGDPARLRQKESQFSLSFIAHSGHRVPPFGYSCFSGRFSLNFGLVRRFQRRGGILTLPQRRKGHTGATTAFPVFHSSNVYEFRSVIPATNRDFPGSATVFRIPVQYRRRRKTVPWYTLVTPV